jgi:hypothetical protein
MEKINSNPTNSNITILDNNESLIDYGIEMQKKNYRILK